LSYHHSKSFASLKNIKERLNNNLTTPQYMRVYDEFLRRAMIPIVVNCRLFDAFLGQLLSFQIKYPRRKVTMSERKALPGLVANFFLATGSEQRIQAYQNLNLDRGVIVSFLVSTLSSFKDYTSAHDMTLRKSTGELANIQECLAVVYAIESSIRSKVTLVQVLSEVKMWLDRALEFKSKILEKYIRLTISAAQEDYVNYFNGSVSLDDLLQTYLAYASRAIDRCDYHQGALTSHIRSYFLAARKSAAKQRDVNTSPEVDVEGIQSEEYSHNEYLTNRSSDEGVMRIARLARIVDPRGYGRAFLGIREAFTELEKSNAQ
jgi:hypothetical protein